MKKVSREQIDKFFAGKQIAIAGVSRNPKKFGYTVFKELRNKGFNILPINPNADEIDGIICFESVEKLPSEVESLVIMTPKERTNEILTQALKRGIKNIWVQQMSDTRDTRRIAKEYDQEIIFGKCIIMFSEPVAGFHKFHRTLVQLFGGMPKNEEAVEKQKETV